MPTTPDSDGRLPLLDVAGGDQAVSRHLRDCLRVLRERTDDPAFRRLVDDVLDGRRGLRDACQASEFTGVLNIGVGRFAQRYEMLSEAEIADLGAEGNRYFADLGRVSEATGNGQRPEPEGGWPRQPG
ncbi:MAG: hypothetical protein HKP61_09800 [Dactylosporangium sp.]|nr:hypothetical protein [Dactylosporangium sp.]NNJ61226.1 hypothetical protein [Dactylosporangium sp.]